MKGCLTIRASQHPEKRLRNGLSPVYVKNHTRRSNNDPPVSPATLLHANPHYAQYARLPSGVTLLEILMRGHRQY